MFASPPSSSHSSTMGSWWEGEGDPHPRYVSSQFTVLAWFWTVGGSRSTWREPTQSQGKRANSAQTGPWPLGDSNQNLFNAKCKPFLTYSTLKTRGGLLLLFVVAGGLTAHMGKVNHQCVLQPAQSCCEGSRIFTFRLPI